ncbi:MAG: Aromatic acid exporter family er 1 [Streptosporangiaceae bacterium]|nr:Aromatic acid exporter family er 1 [Streptosporangiaceae bacterium]
MVIRRLSEPAAAVAGSTDQPAHLSKELRDLLAGLFDDLSEAFTVFGRIQSDPTGTGQVDELRAILRRAEDRQHSAGDSLEASTRPGPERSLVALLDDARRILNEMDPDHGPRQEALTA